MSAPLAPVGQQTTTTTTTTNTAVGGAAVGAGAPVQQIVHNAAVKEVVKPSQLEEIQPVVHRQIDTTEVHQITQPIIEKNVLPTQVTSAVLPTSVRPDVVMGGPAPAMGLEQSSRVVQNTQSSTVVLPAQVQETIVPHVINEVQPVIYREVIAPSVVKEVQPITERIVEAPVVTHTVAAPIYNTGTTGAVGQQGLVGGQQGFVGGQNVVGTGVAPLAGAPVGGFGTGAPVGGLATGGVLPQTTPGHHYAPAGFMGTGLGLKGEEKALAFDNKAEEWAKAGNPTKAARYQQKAQKTRAKLGAAPQQVRTPATGTLDAKRQAKINKQEQRAIRYDQSNNASKAIRARAKANHIRTQAGIPHTVYPGQESALNQGMAGTTVSSSTTTRTF